MKRKIWIIGLLWFGAVLPAFAGQPMVGMEMQEKTEQASHQGKGKVVSVDRANLLIKLAYEPIKSLGWSRMMMDFCVANASLLDGLKAGDAVRFELKQSKQEDLIWVIVKIERK